MTNSPEIQESENDGLPGKAPKERDSSPNPKLDRAVRDLMKKVATSGADIVPEEINAIVRALQTAIMWEKVKHHIKDDEGYDPNF